MRMLISQRRTLETIGRSQRCINKSLARDALARDSQQPLRRRSADRDTPTVDHRENTAGRVHSVLEHPRVCCPGQGSDQGHQEQSEGSRGAEGGDFGGLCGLCAASQDRCPRLGRRLLLLLCLQGTSWWSSRGFLFFQPLNLIFFGFDGSSGIRPPHLGALHTGGVAQDLTVFSHPSLPVLRHIRPES